LQGKLLLIRSVSACQRQTTSIDALRQNDLNSRPYRLPRRGGVLGLVLAPGTFVASLPLLRMTVADTKASAEPGLAPSSAAETGATYYHPGGPGGSGLPLAAAGSLCGRGGSVTGRLPGP
jgi:hypothetical protein